MGTQQNIRVGILGATGYTGVELVRLLQQHPDVRLTVMTSERYSGQPISEVFPALRGQCDIELTSIKIKEIAKQTTFVFSCLPHQKSMLHVPTLLELGSKVVDLSADFRLDSASVYQEWYAKHSAPNLLKEKIYGLPELYRDDIKDAFLVANPGCYPTAAILSLTPLLENQLIAMAPLICDAKSGTSGAGRPPKQETVFGEVNESLRPYGVDRHRHTPEIDQELSKLAGEDISIRFTPHLVPMDRGIIATTYARGLRKLSTDKLVEIFEKRYEKEPFVRVLPPDQLPDTKHVRGTNFCDIAVRFDERTEIVTVMAALDNLNKGAAGQAIQNMNLMSGLDETTGLLGTALIP